MTRPTIISWMSFHRTTEPAEEKSPVACTSDTRDKGDRTPRTYLATLIWIFLLTVRAAHAVLSGAPTKTIVLVSIRSRGLHGTRDQIPEPFPSRAYVALPCQCLSARFSGHPVGFAAEQRLGTRQKWRNEVEHEWYRGDLVDPLEYFSCFHQPCQKDAGCRDRSRSPIVPV